VSRVSRFKDAQDWPDAGFADALREIQTGGKRSHWIWYIFPQLAGLGSSGFAVRYGIADVDEAVEYLRDDTLRERLLTITRAVAAQLRAPRSAPLVRLMGSRIDAQKLVSSMTLFAHVAEMLRTHESASTSVSTSDSASKSESTKARESARGGEALADYAELANLAREVLAAAAAEGYPPCQFTLSRLQD
jgi:uncharacterized protein (DUF1810 family)